LYLRGNPSEAIQKIRDIPKGLDNLYGNLSQGIEQDNRGQSMKLLQWICFASRPLSLRELQQAFTIDSHDQGLSDFPTITALIKGAILGSKHKWLSPTNQMLWLRDDVL
jgi:hypothetical protein